MRHFGGLVIRRPIIAIVVQAIFSLSQSTQASVNVAIVCGGVFRASSIRMGAFIMRPLPFPGALSQANRANDVGLGYMVSPVRIDCGTDNDQRTRLISAGMGGGENVAAIGASSTSKLHLWERDKWRSTRACCCLARGLSDFCCCFFVWSSAAGVKQKGSPPR